MHFLPPKDILEESLPRNRAAVTVMVKQRRGKATNLTVQPGIKVVPEGTRITRLPAQVRVLTPEGEVIEPTGHFYVTIDPYHLVLDLF